MAETQQLNLYQKLAKITGEIGVIAKDDKTKGQKHG
nr:MAG TPA: vascular endothelial growth factor A [Caudoviricetes sp.]